MALRVAGSHRTLCDVMQAALQADGDREAYVDAGLRLTFDEWDRAASGVAALFSEAGVGRGDVVCLLLPASVDYAISYQAAVRLGAVTSGVNPRLGAGEVASILRRSGPKVIVQPGSRRGPNPIPDGVVSRLLTVDETRASWRRDAPPRLPKLDPSDPVALVWTSGTTGDPKGAVFDHSNLAAVAAGAGDLSAPKDRRLSPLPFAHVGYMTRPWDELTNLITTVIVPSRWKASEALRLMEDERVTVAQGVPTQWRLLLSLPELESADLSGLRVAGTGASNVPPELVREMRSRLGVPVVVGYTCTEAAITTRSRIEDSDEDIAQTVGRPSEGVQLRVVGEDGHPLPTGRVGKVQCRSPAVMRGYWRDPSLTSEVLSSDGWLSTGDLGSLDERGYLTLAGRVSDTYIRGGYNVHPVEVEALLSQHPGVGQVAVVGVGDEVLGEVGVAFLVPSPSAASKPPEVEELRAWCRTTLADYKAPDLVYVVEALPLTAMAKVDRAALRTEARERRRSP